MRRVDACLDLSKVGLPETPREELAIKVRDFWIELSGLLERCELLHGKKPKNLSRRHVKYCDICAVSKKISRAIKLVEYAECWAESYPTLSSEQAREVRIQIAVAFGSIERELNKHNVN